MTYNIEDKIDEKYNTALEAAATRDVRIASGAFGQLKKTNGGIYTGASVLVSDCETTTTSATSRGVWAAKTATSTLAAAATWNLVGTNSITVTAGASAAAGDGAVHTRTTGYELDLRSMNFLGFWFYMDDNINVFDADGDLTVRMYDGTTKVYEYAVPAAVAATPHGTLPQATTTDYYIECPLSSTYIVSGQSLANVTSIEVLKTTTAMNDTKLFCVEYMEAYEISAGGWPFKTGIIMPFTDSGSGVTRGDYIELANAYSRTVKTGATDNGTNYVGKACNTAAASGTVYVIVQGPTVAVANEAMAVGVAVGVADASVAVVDDTGGATTGGQYLGKVLGAAGAQYDMIPVMLLPAGASDGS